MSLQLVPELGKFDEKRARIIAERINQIIRGDWPEIALQDGVPVPNTPNGKAVLYIDAADGDLKIKFGDGTVKTIVTDT